jgi:hypothetical protein
MILRRKKPRDGYTREVDASIRKSYGKSLTTTQNSIIFRGGGLIMIVWRVYNTDTGLYKNGTSREGSKWNERGYLYQSEAKARTVIKRLQKYSTDKFTIVKSFIEDQDLIEVT